jgi:hypothetical protein
MPTLADTGSTSDLRSLSAELADSRQPPSIPPVGSGQRESPKAGSEWQVTGGSHSSAVAHTSTRTQSPPAQTRQVQDLRPFNPALG